MCAGILKILAITWSPIAFKTQCVQQSTEAEYTQTHTHTIYENETLFEIPQITKKCLMPFTVSSSLNAD